jgi:hypothetical protein
VRTALFCAVLLALGFSMSAEAADFRSFGPPLFRGPLFHDVYAYVTGYNTVPGQTDDTPCIAASGANICGRTDAVACPRHISLGTFLDIRGMTYVCEDRLAKKYDSRFDISCDKDTNCPGEVTGWVKIKVFSEDPCRLPPPAPAIAAITRPLVHFAAFVPRAFHRIVRLPMRFGLRARARWSRPA